MTFVIHIRLYFFAEIDEMFNFRNNAIVLLHFAVNVTDPRGRYRVIYFTLAIYKLLRWPRAGDC